MRARIAENREFVMARRDNPPQKVSPAGPVVFDRDGNPVDTRRYTVTTIGANRPKDGSWNSPNPAS